MDGLPWTYVLFLNAKDGSIKSELKSFKYGGECFKNVSILRYSFIIATF